MTTLNNREKTFGRTAIVLNKMADDFLVLKSTIKSALAEDGLQQGDKDVYEELEELLHRFLTGGVIPFLEHAIDEDLTHPESLKDLL